MECTVIACIGFFLVVSRGDETLSVTPPRVTFSVTLRVRSIDTSTTIPYKQMLIGTPGDI